ncbi:DUF4861 domain-containing protein [Gramella jeungdoensis]|uniref:DUF4861 domain-containing protein n=1 Tax=Gramella jeungdoensis TaxID=708091 RepID=A0ABT0YZU1_9FLAO|nr:DUF4861 family protein [Gramella jeungdoensis]MCM8568422.1 DUF4861 domain-containing protein [Gramella jeungdoensis]
MKKLILLFLATLSIVSCNDGKKEKEATVETKEETETLISNKTYAEISVKEGGKWEGREYKGGEFKNVDSLSVPENHTDHSWFIRYEGPGWENKNVGYRLYLDWRNAIDIFGKKVDTLVLPYVGQDGFDSYHEEADWGLDILKAGKSMGIGGYGRYMNDTVAHFRNVGNTIATVINTESRSSVEIFYEDWATGKDTIDLEAKLSIFPEGRYTKAELTPSAEIDGLTTGIVKHGPQLIKRQSENGKWAYIATYGAQTLVNENDKLGMAVFYNTDELDKQIEGTDDHLVVFKPTTETITYYFLGAWEQEKDGITTKEDFLSHLDELLKELNSNNTLN